MAYSILIDLTLLALLLAASVFDLIQRRIPNRLLLAALIAALGLHLANGTPMVLLSTCLGGFALGLVMFLPLYMCGAMAAGDVKLMAVVGAFTGPALAFPIALASYCFGGVLAIVMALCMRRGRAVLANVGQLLRPLWMRACGLPLPAAVPVASVGGMPYAVAISMGTLLVLWLRHS
ncbi:MAG: prepilin peptidase [Gammaproteobacteria bacterium]